MPGSAAINQDQAQAQAQANLLDKTKKDAVNSSEFGPRSLEVAYFLLYVAMALVAIAFVFFLLVFVPGGRGLRPWRLA